jgi:hypothetical protein
MTLFNMPSVGPAVALRATQGIAMQLAPLTSSQPIEGRAASLIDSATSDAQYQCVRVRELEV